MEALSADYEIFPISVSMLRRFGIIFLLISAPLVDIEVVRSESCCQMLVVGDKVSVVNIGQVGADGNVIPLVIVRTLLNVTPHGADVYPCMSVQFPSVEFLICFVATLGDRFCHLLARQGRRPFPI
jgi:hypothetical protein